MKKSLAALVLALSTSLAACDADRLTSIVVQDELALETAVSASVIGRGETMTLTYGLRNISSGDVTVIFGGCGPLPYVKASGGQILFPSGGGWICPGAITRVTLTPGQRIAKTVQITGGEIDATRTDRVTLSPGRYRAYADVAGWVESYDRRLELRSPDVSFRVRD